MRIADAEGFDAVSMRRIATELDAGTMTLYHYVRTKDELLTLVVDAVMGEVVVPTRRADARPTGAPRCTLIAERTRAALQRHPWILDITDDPPIGPNSVRHFDQSLQAVASLPLTLAEKLDIVTAVDEYVFGFCLHERNNLQRRRRPVRRRDDRATSTTSSRPATTRSSRRWPRSTGSRRAGREIDDHLRDPTRFDRNLRRLLDGIEADLATR